MAKKIMIVEDDTNIVDYLVALFEDNGYETCTAGTGVEAIKIARDQPPDLITLDLMMPGSWGNVFYRKLQKEEELKSIPIIIISGAEDELPKGDLSKAVVMKLDKAAAYLKKPFDKDELLGIVKKLLGD